jgi:ubiquinone/menaquinone biosynthesis C-methylase UbiE
LTAEGGPTRLFRVTKRDAWRDERVAGEYEARRFRTPLGRLKHRRDVRLVLALLRGVPRVRVVLDLPCGTGRLLPALRAEGYRATGADVALEMLRQGLALRPGRAALVQADVAALPFRSGAFDAVVSLRFLFHLSVDERRRCFAEMRRVARGGVVLGEVRYRRTLKHLARWLRSRMGLAARYRPSAGRGELEAELAAAGLELLRLRPVSRLFSDKALFLAGASAHGLAAGEVPADPARAPGAGPGRQGSELGGLRRS